MKNKEGAEAPTFKMQTKDRELLINQFNESGKIWKILPIHFNCNNITNNCLECNDGQETITLCSESDLVMMIIESGDPVEFSPFEILTEILETDPMYWLINEGWITTTTAEGQLLSQQIGKVSYFSNPISNIYPDKEITVGEVYEYIRGETLKDVTTELREIKKLDEKKFKVEKTKLLPSVTFSGTYEIRSGNKLKECSGLMCFDIDHLDNIEITINALLEDTYLGTVLLFTSPSGEGLKLVIRSSDEANYTKTYQSIRAYLKIKHNITTDSTQDISRACFLCHDPDAYYNDDASPTRLPETKTPISLGLLSRHEPNNGGINKIYDDTPNIEKVEAYISELEKKEIDITDIYDDWVKVGFSFASLGEEGRPFFHRLSKMFPHYTYVEADKKFTNLLHTGTGRISLATFFYYCHKIGVRSSKTISANYMTAPLLSAKTGTLPWQNKTYGTGNENAVNRNQKTDTVPEEIDWDDVLRRHQINPTDEIPKPPLAWKNGEATCGTLGNFSLFIGKAKSRKSFFVSLVIAGVLNPDDQKNPISGALPKDKNKVLYFDTEQGKYHVQCALKRICTMIGCEGSSAELIVYALRPLSPQERMAAIDHAITTTDGVGLVVIDGVADLQTDINNPEQAVMVATKLLKWTEIYSIHIITVLHANKGDQNARGHLGTELVNKAETTLSVTKDKVNTDISIVEPEYCRNKDPEPFAFEINEDGLPVESREYAQRTGNSVKAENLVDDAITQIFNRVFDKNDKISYASLWQSVKLAYHSLYTGNLPDNQAKIVVERAKYNGIISQDRLRGPYSLVTVKG